MTPALEARMKEAMRIYGEMSPIDRYRMFWDQRVAFVYNYCSPDITLSEVEEEMTKIYGPRP